MEHLAQRIVLSLVIALATLFAPFAGNPESQPSPILQAGVDSGSVQAESSLGGFAPVAASCMATLDDGLTVLTSSDSAALRAALATAPLGSMVKVSGTCAGAVFQGGSTQVAIVSQTITLAGGYTPTDWSTAYPITQPTTLDAAGGGRVILASAAATLQGLIIKGGNISGNGGGLFATLPLTISTVIIVGNTASSDGGGAWFGQSARVSGSSFVSNTGFLGGGALFDGPASVSDSSFVGNHGGVGGGAAFSQLAVVSGSEFSRNTAHDGGGASFSGQTSVSDSGFTGNWVNANGGGAIFWTTATISGSRFAGNAAQVGTGGGAMVGAAVITGTSFVNNSAGAGGGAGINGFTSISGGAFRGNSAQNAGGGAYVSGDLSARNTLFARNVATTTGSAIEVMAGSGATAGLTLIHATISGSGAASGSAIHINRSSVFYPANAVLTNTIIRNYATGIALVNGAASEDYSLFDNVVTPRTGPVTAGGYSITGTAAFVNAADDDYRLGTGSSAIDAGVDAGVATDFKGTPRPIGAGFDIGYDEYIPPRAWLPFLRR